MRCFYNEDVWRFCNFLVFLAEGNSGFLVQPAAKLSSGIRLLGVIAVFPFAKKMTDRPIMMHTLACQG
jgi:hypothetical protein